MSDKFHVHPTYLGATVVHDGVAPLTVDYREVHKREFIERAAIAAMQGYIAFCGDTYSMAKCARECAEKLYKELYGENEK